jgi:hypothetical protein
VSDAGENGNGQPANENNSQSISNINRPAVNLLDERRRRLKEFQDSIERPTAPAALSLMPHDTTTNLYFAVADETENPKSESCVSQWIHSVDHLFANSSEEHLATIQMNDNADWQTETAQCLEIPVDRQEDDDPADDESDIIDHYTVETAEQNKPSVDAAKEISAAIDVTDQNTNHLIQRLAGQVQMMTTAMQKLMERVETTEKLIHLQ